MNLTKVFLRPPFYSFYPKNLVLDPQKLKVRVLSDAYMINPKLYLFIYGLVFCFISGLKGKNYQYFGSSLNLFKTTPESQSRTPLLHKGSPWVPRLKALRENPAWPSTYPNKCLNGTFTPQGEKLFQIILKFMHKCRSYGNDKLYL